MTETIKGLPSAQTSPHSGPELRMGGGSQPVRREPGPLPRPIQLHLQRPGMGRGCTLEALTGQSRPWGACGGAGSGGVQAAGSCWRARWGPAAPCWTPAALHLGSSNHQLVPSPGTALPTMQVGELGEPARGAGLAGGRGTASYSERASGRGSWSPTPLPQRKPREAIEPWIPWGWGEGLGSPPCSQP